MKNKTILSAILLTSMLFNYFFWQEALALNLVLFTTSIISIIIGSRKLRPNKWQLTHIFLTLLSAITVLYHGTSFSVWVHIGLFLITVGSLQFEKLANQFFSLMVLINNYFKLPASLFGFSTTNSRKRRRHKKIEIYTQLAIFPAVALLVFFMIYHFANPVFADLSGRFFGKINDFFVQVFDKVSLSRMLFFMVGLIITSGLFLIHSKNSILSYYSRLKTILVRRRNVPPFRGKLPELKYELISATLFLALINVLLLIVNTIDISWIWFGFTVTENFSLKQFVHEGTYLLILSILMAMGVMFYYFRGNINFLKNNNKLKYLAYLWIVQNVILAVSVFLRNYHYIQYHGLAYKRIGVIVFLLVTISGLFLLFNKIKHRKTAYYTFHLNTYFFVAIMVGMSFFNWDKVICNYNLSFGNNGNIDAGFYLKMNPSVYPIIHENLEVIHGQISAHRVFKKQWLPITIKEFDLKLKEKTEQYIISKKEQSWLSWNWADQKSLTYFEKSQPNKEGFLSHR